MALCLSLHAHVADAIAGLDEGAADIVVADDAEFEGMPAACAKPIAAGVPESGTGTTMSASTGLSRASSAPMRLRTS